MTGGGTHRPARYRRPRRCPRMREGALDRDALARGRGADPDHAGGRGRSGRGVCRPSRPSVTARASSCARTGQSPITTVMRIHGGAERRAASAEIGRVTDSGRPAPRRPAESEGGRGMRRSLYASTALHAVVLLVGRVRRCPVLRDSPPEPDVQVTGGPTILATAEFEARTQRGRADAGRRRNPRPRLAPRPEAPPESEAAARTDAARAR